jgi:hypothetical protein
MSRENYFIVANMLSGLCVMSAMLMAALLLTAGTGTVAGTLQTVAIWTTNPSNCWRCIMFKGWNWTERAHNIGEGLTLALCVGAYWLVFWVLF